MRREIQVVVLIAAACGGSTAQPGPGPVTSITVTPAAAPVAVGATQSFAAALKDAQGNVANGVVTWTSSDPAIATIGASTGLATGVKAGGPITITATAGSVQGTAQSRRVNKRGFRVR
jgi:uncharacterized protein YjdB